MLWIQAWLCERKQTVVVEGETSKPVNVKSGVPQGTVLGPLMFLMYINDIDDGIKSQIRLFADDTILYAVIKSSGDASLLQRDLDKLVEWSKLWQMCFNPEKCKVLRIHRSRNPVLHQYSMEGTVLESVDHHPYLGIELSSNLNWGNHISNIVGKANRTLGFLRRNLGRCPEVIKNQAYTTLVRPRLEYACSVWDPHTQKNSKDIESIQRRAARFVKGCYLREPGTVTNLLKDLNWPILQQRRKSSRLTMMFKIVNNLCPITVPEYVHQKSRVTRSFHPKRFINMGSSSNTYKFSFFARTVKEWNDLPTHLIEEKSIISFKSALAANLDQ